MTIPVDAENAFDRIKKHEIKINIINIYKTSTPKIPKY